MDSSVLPMDSIDSVPVHVLWASVLRPLAPYAPALRLVCHRWDRAFDKLGPDLDRPHTLSGLARLGHTDLLRWERKIRKDAWLMRVDQILMGAVTGRHTDI